jgi:phosphoribosylformimino-5-aminoimidazole carboxamide ribotide isomerase
MPEFPERAPARIFPAIDVRGGRCVRLVKGRKDAEIHCDDDPLGAARRWEAAGADCLHVIDLGAAFGEPASTETLLEIARRVAVPVQAGGGVRDAARLERLLAGGIGRVILGTRALGDPAFLEAVVGEHGPGRIAVALDCEGERVKVAGWQESSPLAIPEALERVRAAGVRHILVTATDRDGTLGGPRLDLLERFLAEDGLRVVAAGGIGRLEDVRAILALGRPALEGIVIGRALYEGTVDLAAALALARKLATEERP